VHSSDPFLAISYLKKALERAKESKMVVNRRECEIVYHYLHNILGGDSYQEGKSCYRLGNAFEEQGDPDSAITVRCSQL